MYYRDIYGNAVEYSPEEQINLGQVYHPLTTKEDFNVSGVQSWFEKYKLWFVYALVIVIVFIVLIWLWNKKYPKRNTASVFY